MPLGIAAHTPQSYLCFAVLLCALSTWSTMDPIVVVAFGQGMSFYGHCPASVMLDSLI